MTDENAPAELLRTARARAGITQRELALKAGTSQSVVARIELGETSPTWTTLTRLLRAAGFRAEAGLTRIRTLDRQLLDDIPRILSLSPEDRLREVALVDRFVVNARRV